MELLSWVLLGATSGIAASRIVEQPGQGVVLDMLVAAIGALVGGWAFAPLGIAGTSGFAISMLAAESVAIWYLFHVLAWRQPPLRPAAAATVAISWEGSAGLAR
jgi:uncharacterized membrane protein YeaQ/YmgE (transglycosylase-associated protein family)